MHKFLASLGLALALAVPAFAGPVICPKEHHSKPFAARISGIGILRLDVCLDHQEILGGNIRFCGGDFDVRAEATKVPGSFRLLLLDGDKVMGEGEADIVCSRVFGTIRCAELRKTPIPFVAEPGTGLRPLRTDTASVGPNTHRGFETRVDGLGRLHFSVTFSNEVYGAFLQVGCCIHEIRVEQGAERGRFRLTLLSGGRVLGTGEAIVICNTVSGSINVDGRPFPFMALPER